MTGREFIDEARRLGLTFSRNGDRLAVTARPGALTPEVKAWLSNEKATILRAVDAALEPEGEPVEFGPDGWPIGSIEPGAPCPRCGGLTKWWDLLGGEHCQQCEGETLKRAHQWAKRVERLRR